MIGAPEPAAVVDAPLDVASVAGLYAGLARIEGEGWDGPTAAAVLTYAREHVVRPQVARARLRGAVADQAEATGWEVAWEVLRALGPVSSPWGVVASAVRRAVLGEVVAAAYATDARSAWRLLADPVPTGDDPLQPVRGARPAAPVSLTLLAERGWEPPEPALETAPSPVLDLIAAAMVAAGWERRETAVVMQWVGSQAGRARPGWRALAARAGMPPWRARRATVLLVGAPGWRGLVERVALQGPAVLERPDLVAAIRSTTRASHRSPAAAARLATSRCEAPYRRAS